MRARQTFAAVAAVAVGLALASTPSAGAQLSSVVVAAADIRADGEMASAAGQLVPDPAVADLASEKGLSLQDAEQRIEWQQRAPDLDAALATAVGPDRHGGVWIGNDDRVKVGIVESGTAAEISAARSAVGTYAAASQLAGATDIQPVRYSLSALLTANDWLGDQLERVNSNAEWPLESGYTTAGNTVRLGLPPQTAALTPAQQAVVDQARQRFGAMLDVYTYTERAQADECTFLGTTYCDPPLRAGVLVNPHGCTLGFLARSRADHKLYAFTAGHCVDDDPSTTTYYTRFPDNSLHNIGPRQNFEFSGRGDASIIRVTNEAGWRARAWVVVVDSPANGGEEGTTYNPQYPILRDGTSTDNMRVCHSGVGVGTSCGRVTELGVAHTYDEDNMTVRGMAKTSYCRGPGDSGGPVFAGGTAYGLHGAGSGCVGYYQGIRGAENLMNVDVSFEAA